MPNHTLPGAPLQRIVLAVGLPACGKSSWFQKQGILPLSSDQLRLLLADDENEQHFQSDIFGALRALLRLRLAFGREVSYVDATNLQQQHRRPFLEIARVWGSAAEAIYFDVPLEVCLARNAARGRVVPEQVMRTMAEKLEPPTLAEGFQRILILDERGQTRTELARRPAGKG